MLRVVILGTGNVATHLFAAFSQLDTVAVVQVVGRSENALKKFSSSTAVSQNFNCIAEAEVYVIAVADDAIPQVSSYLSHKKDIVVHTSGAMPMDCLAPENRGVFYPLQTFTAGKPVDFTSIPIGIEAKKQSSLTVLRQLAEALSQTVYEIDSKQRKTLHLAAVFVNNFTNHLYHIGEMLCQQEGVSFELLRPLILETAQKVQSLSPAEAQTGPARRGDQNSMQAHRTLLSNKAHAELYTLFSKAIQHHYAKKL